MNSVPFRHNPLARALASSLSMLIASCALAACGGGSSGNDAKPKSTAADAAAAATMSFAGAASAASEASAPSADLAASGPMAQAAGAARSTDAPPATAPKAAPAAPPQAARPAPALVAARSTPAPAPAQEAAPAPAQATAPKAAVAQAPVVSLLAPAPTPTPQSAAPAPVAVTAAAPAAAPAPAAVAATSPSQQAAITASLSSTQVDSLLKSGGLLLPVRAATENWSNARKLIASNPGWATWLNQKRAAVDHWYSQTRDRADLIAGLPNDYVDPVTGAAVSWVDDSPEPATGTTDRQKAYKAAWVAILRQVNIGYALDAARLYQVTGDAKMAETAAAQLDFYADNYGKWPLRTAIGNSRMFGQTLEEATTVLSMLETAHALGTYATPARKAKWRDGLFLPIANNLQAYSWGSLNNMNLWCAVATAAIGMELGNATWTDAGLTGPRSVAAVMTQGVTTDGIWYEGSFAYNNYVLVALARLFDLAAINGRNDIVTKYSPLAQRMLLAPVIYRFDDGSLPSPNDTRSAVAPVDTYTHTVLYRHVPTTYGVQNAQGYRTWSSLSDPPPALAGTPQLPPIQTVYSPDIGFASLRAGSWQAFVHYGQKTQAHAQAEALSYELAHGSINITRDAGTSNSYGSPQHLEYFSQGLGNNVPLVDGQGPDGYTLGEVKAFDPAAGTLDVLQAKYRNDASARRTYKVDAAGFTETTRLTLSQPAAAARRLAIVFNTSCTVQVTDPRAGAATAVPAPTGAPGFKYWTGITRQTAQATWTARLSCAGKPYELSFTGPAGHSVYRATAPSTPLPSTRNTLYLEAVGTDASFTTSIRAL